MADLNFADLLEAVAETFPDRTAIIQGDLRRSWREFDERTNRLARHLIDAGLTPGSKVGFYLRNSPAYPELLAACFKARLTHVNVNYRYVDRELLHIFADADVECIVFDEAFSEQVHTLLDELPLVRTSLVVSSGKHAELTWCSDFENACTAGDGSPLGIERSGDDLYFMYTGGTTGQPKAVMWPHKERIRVIALSDAEDARAHARALLEAGAPPLQLVLCPMMHSTGFTGAVTALCRGGTVVFLQQPGFDAVECLNTIETRRITQIALVGDAFSVPLIEALGRAERSYDLSSVELIFSAGAMWSANYKEQLLAYFPNASLRDALGSSEGSRLASAELQQGETTSTGRFLPGPDTRVFTEDFKDVVPGSGQPGLIATSGAIPLGYYKDEAKTATTFPTVNGVRYSVPGDWCLVEEDGSLTLLGRGSNCINTGGEKVYPEEVEDALKQHPQVLDAAVFGIPDPRWGQAVAAVAQLRQPGAVDSAAVDAALRTRLAAYKCPKRIVFVADELRADNGKMLYDKAKTLFTAHSE